MWNAKSKCNAAIYTSFPHFSFIATVVMNFFCPIEFLEGIFVHFGGISCFLMGIKEHVVKLVWVWLVFRSGCASLHWRLLCNASCIARIFDRLENNNSCHWSRAFPRGILRTLTTVWDLTVIPLLISIRCIAPRSVHITVWVSALLIV